MKKYFTLEEANALLPVIQTELEKLQSLKQEIEQKYSQLKKWEYANQSDAGSFDDEIFAREAEIDFIMLQAQMHIDQIHHTGAELKEIDLGLIDFPAIKDGEEILLCWKQGETSVSHWHGIHEGYMRRKEL